MILIFDVETTGKALNFNAPITDLGNWPRIVQLSWQCHDNAGNLIKNQDYIVKPDGFDIPYATVAIHGITTEMAYELGLPLQEVIELFLSDLQQAQYIAGHNVIFDINVTAAEFLRLGKENPFTNKKSIDSMLLSTQWAALQGGIGGKLKSPTLAELYEKLFQEKIIQAHNAAADVNATARAIFELIRIGGITQDADISEDVIIAIGENFGNQKVPEFKVDIRDQIKINSKKKKTKTDDLTMDLGDYFPLHNHSVFSILQSTTKIPDLLQHAKDQNFPAIGMVDFGNMIGAYKFVAAVEDFNKKNEIEEGFIPIKAIIGLEIHLSDRPHQKQFTKDDPDRRTLAVLIAKNKIGYKNLAKISSEGFVHGFYFGVPRVHRDFVAEHSEGIIALTGGLQADIPHEIIQYGDLRGEEKFKWWKDIFGEDFYVQIQNHGIEEEQYLNSLLIKLADKYQVKILPQNETFYSKQEDASVQEMLLCIKEGEKLDTPIGRGFGKRYALPTKNFHLLSREEVEKNYTSYSSYFDTYSELLAKIDSYTLRAEVVLPTFTIPEEFKPDVQLNDVSNTPTYFANEYLRHLTYLGAEKRYKTITKEISERIDFELKTIENSGYPGYFLIVQDFCAEARKMGVSVGPGRGSAAGSVVAYCLQITDVDPLEYDLLFERFLNPDRVSLPDIDIDFDDVGRDDVIKWVTQKYGARNVAQIITCSYLGGKSAIKDAGRVMGISIAETNAIAKLVPALPSFNITKALEEKNNLAPDERNKVKEIERILADPKDKYHDLLSASYKMEGCIRNTGVHPCGVIITPDDISNFIPISIPAKDDKILVSQFDNYVVEGAGLLKMDFLGLRTLTIIKDAMNLVQKKTGKPIDWAEISLEDDKTLQLFREGRTVGIFQYESLGMQKYLKELQPSRFADLIAMNALFRPGPLAYIPEFVARRHKRKKVEYDLPEMEEILADTYGITVYQEQVMRLSQKLAGFTKGEADVLRKGMGKKDMKTLNALKDEFLHRGEEKGHPRPTLEKIWKDWEAFGKYAFNKSHSTCYAILAFRTAYLKAHYPGEYMASVMSNNINNITQIASFMEDCRGMSTDVLGPDVNESSYAFSVNSAGQIRFGLGAIKGIGEVPSEAIVSARAEVPFKNLWDFLERVPYQQLNKRVMESLIFSGALDVFSEIPRAQYFQTDALGKSNLEKLVQYAQNFQSQQESASNSLFADFASEIAIEKPNLEHYVEVPSIGLLNKEKDVIGLYLSAHPLDEFKPEILFLKGRLNRNINPNFYQKIVAQKQLEEHQPDTVSSSSLDFNTNTTDMLMDTMDDDLIDDGTMEEETIGVEIIPEGPYNYLPLSGIENFKSKFKDFHPEQFFSDDTPYRNKQETQAKAPKFTTAGMITEYTVRDGRNPGEKTAFLTLEDYTGTSSFRLGDKDYLRLRDQLEVGRFVVLQFKFSPSRDGQAVFINVDKAESLADIWENFVKRISVQINPEDFIFKEVKDIFTVVKSNKNTASIAVGFEIIADTIKDVEAGTCLVAQTKKLSMEPTKEKIHKLLANFGEDKIKFN